MNMWVIEVWATASYVEPEIIGPFPDREWAKKYAARVLDGRSFRLEYRIMLPPTLFNKDGEVVFDPTAGIDRQ